MLLLLDQFASDSPWITIHKNIIFNSVFIMKAITLGLLAILCISLVSCYPDKTDIKKLKEEANRKKACLHSCDSVKYEPICAGKNEKKLSFANECVMNNYNCENKETLHKISNGECPGGQGIRLS